MNGTISVKSEYHVGSTFSFKVPQQVEFFEPIAQIEDSARYRILVFEKNEDLSDNIKKVLESLGVSADYALSRMEFEAMLLSNRYSHVIIASERYLSNIRFIERKLKDEKLIVICEISQSIQLDRNGYLLIRPVHIMNVAMAIQSENNSFVREIITKGGFSCPDANILVVDDNITNLDVAMRLLKKYDANVLTASSGAECITILNTHPVDLVFLDYMMPEMNGIDTLEHIRNLPSQKLKQLPIIALTANVINGAREMFLEAGFCEYIAKPIEIDRLERALKTFLPKDLIVLKNK